MAGFHETVLGMMGERRITGRVETQWSAAVLHLGAGRLTVADVHDVGPSGLSLRMSMPVEVGDILEIAIRDPHRDEARVAGQVTNVRRGTDLRVGVQLSRLDRFFIERVVSAFQADMLAARREPRVDFGLADVTPLPRSREAVTFDDWTTAPLADVIPYRRVG